MKIQKYDKYKETPLQKAIYDLLVESGPITRAEIVAKLYRARTTIYDSIEKLMVRNLVKSYPIPGEIDKEGRPKKGRPLVLFEAIV